MSGGAPAADLDPGAALRRRAGHDEHHAGIRRPAVAADARGQCGTLTNARSQMEA